MSSCCGTFLESWNSVAIKCSCDVHRMNIQYNSTQSSTSTARPTPGQRCRNQQQKNYNLENATLLSVNAYQVVASFPVSTPSFFSHVVNTENKAGSAWRLGMRWSSKILTLIKLPNPGRTTLTLNWHTPEGPQQ